MLDVDMADLLDYLAADSHTDAVILYVESIENARAFMSAARACARRKPIVAYKAGRFAESAQAAASHTGAMAGVDSVYEAAFERAGMVRVYEVDALFQCAQLLARGPRIQGERLAIVTNAGGPGVMACDALLARHGKLATLSQATLQQLDRMLPTAWSHGNPVDVLGDATPARFARALETVVADDQVDAVLAILTPQAMTDPSAIARAVVDLANPKAKPILANWMGGRMVREGVQILNQAGIPTAATPNDAIAGFMHLVRYSRNQDLLYETPRDVAPRFDGPDRESHRRLRQVFATDRDILFEAEAKTLLSAYGLSVAEVCEATTVEDVLAAARAVGFPVVLKVVSPQITHKTDVGGVVLGLSNEAQVREAHANMLANVRRARPDARIQAVSVQPMVALPGGIELIIGAKKDPVFGPVIMVGVGGIAAELFHDRALGLPPLNERLALHMLQSLRAWPLVTGYRGREPIADVDCLIEVMLRVAQLVTDFPEIGELDANPVLVRGRQAIVLDARIVVDRGAIAKPAARRYAHLAIRPYPTDLQETTVLADGTRLTVRPIRPEDEPLWHELLARCSAETLRRRFHAAFNPQPHEAAIRFCFVDYDRELTAVAEATIDGKRQLLGVARLSGDGHRHAGEFAVLVGEAWQGKGLGNRLTEYCLRHAGRIQVDEVYGVTQRDNQRMIQVFKRWGFRLEPASDPTLLVATLRLADRASAPDDDRPAMR
jgi:acetyltransferase